MCFLQPVKNNDIFSLPLHHCLSGQDHIIRPRICPGTIGCLVPDLSVRDVSVATGLTGCRIAQIEQGRGALFGEHETVVLRGFYQR